MPSPLSLTPRTTYWPGCPPITRAAASSTSAFAVSIVSLPPFGIASRALTTRLTTTWEIWPGSAFTLPRPGP
jgi:hypothetical protein